MPVLIIQTYEPIDELKGADGILPCEERLALKLIAERRAERLNPHLEAFRYLPGSRAYEAMRASRGMSGPVMLRDAPQGMIPGLEDALPDVLPSKRSPGRPRKTEAAT